MRFKKYFLAVFVIILFILVLFSQLTKPKLLPKLTESKESVTILMEKDQFAPDTIEIKKGTKVIFKNEDIEDRWPASNLHPTHGIYPEFDPQQPITVGGQWSFVFDKVGSFKYHDHLLPSLRGVITVTQ